MPWLDELELPTNLRDSVMIFNYMLDEPPSRSNENNAESDEEEDMEITEDFIKGRVDQCCRHVDHS